MTKALGRAIIVCTLRSVGDESKGFLALGRDWITHASTPVELN